MKTENLSTLKIHKLSQEQYDREYKAENLDPNAIYLTPDDGSSNNGPGIVYVAQDTAPEDTSILWLDTSDDSQDDGSNSVKNVDLTGYEKYITSRSELEVKHEDINTERILKLYDELVELFPGKVQKREIRNNDGTFINYEYVFSSGEYNTEGIRQANLDRHIKKPKYLILSGIHGSERKAVLSTYRFFSDIIRGQFLVTHLREGSEIHVVPIGNPSGIDAFTRGNENGIDLNRNFDWNWSEKGAGTLNYTGPTAASEKETQAITNWLNANSDAELFIDFHNSSVVNEVALLIGLTGNKDCDRAKEVALRGLDRIVPHWRDAIGYPPQECRQLDDTLAIQDPIFSLSVSLSTGGGAIFYATEVAGITSLCLETSVLQRGNYSDFEANPHLCPPETIAAGAEALGNILLEFYSQYCNEDIPTKPEDIGAQPVGNYLTAVPEGYATEQYVKDYSQPKGEYLTATEFNSMKEPLIVSLFQDGTTDKNNAEIMEAWLGGRQVIALHGGSAVTLIAIREGVPIFSGVVDTNTVTAIVTGNTYEMVETKLAASSDIPTKVSDLENDLELLTKDQLGTILTPEAVFLREDGTTNLSVEDINLAVLSGRRVLAVLENITLDFSGFYAGLGAIFSGFIGTEAITAIVTESGYTVERMTFATEEYVNNKMLESIKTPTQASIGQTIVVKAVDANGRPTEWDLAPSIPTPTADDEGKVLKVVNGVVTWQSMQVAEGVLY